ncbi:hypothetical protein Pcac1_g23985 [Phytophthora cactorum]|nr:hypothetical protein Pcac1_g23985 [Phytophthora cactorum]
MRCFSCFYKCFGRDESLSTPKGDVPTDTAATVVEETSVAASPKGKGKVTDSYTLGKVIGSGSYSVVRESVHKKSKHKFAIKCIKRSELSTEDDEAIQFEPILFKKIRKGKYYFDSPYWDNVSTDAKEFISKMLVVNPKERATAGELLEHKWITGTDVATVPLTSALTELRRFHARKKFKAAVHSVQATISMNKALSGLGESARNSNSAVSL